MVACMSDAEQRYRIIYGAIDETGREVQAYFTYPWKSCLEMVRRSLEPSSKVRAKRVERA